MDLNENSLDAAARRLSRYEPAIHRADVLEPWGLDPGAFDSVAMTHLLHCLPGSIAEKAVAFDHARVALGPGGVLFGATILGDGVEHSRASRWVLEASNRRGLMTNREDSPRDLEDALAERFPSVSVEVVGRVALFSAVGSR